MTTQKIAELNDMARSQVPFSGSDHKTLWTQGISALPHSDQAVIMDRVRSFDDFTNDNDPYGEHDFGQVEYDGNKIFWKIDYYDRGMTSGSNDPTDPEQTMRVITIMLAEEY